MGGVRENKFYNINYWYSNMCNLPTVWYLRQLRTEVVRYIVLDVPTLTYIDHLGTSVVIILNYVAKWRNSAQIWSHCCLNATAYYVKCRSVNGTKAPFWRWKNLFLFIFAERRKMSAVTSTGARLSKASFSERFSTDTSLPRFQVRRKYFL